MNATFESQTARLQEINEATAGLPADKVEFLAPSLWREKRSLENAIVRAGAEASAIDEAKRADQLARERAEKFPSALESFREKARAVGQPTDDAAEAFSFAFGQIEALMEEHSALTGEARAVGANMPTLADLVGIPQRRLERFTYAAGLVRMRDS